MESHPPVLFALGASHAYGARIAARLGVRLADHEEREFEDGHHKVRSLVSVRERDVYVIHSLHGDDLRSVNDKLCRLLFFLGSLRDAAARRVTAVVPFLSHTRKDRKTKPRDPVTTRYVAMMFEAVGVDRVVTLDVHNLAAFQNAFRCRTEHLEARGLFCAYLVSELDQRPVAIVSPDVGGIKRAEALRSTLESRLDRQVAFGVVEKHRRDRALSGEAVVGDVSNRVVILVDDMISSGGTVARAARACAAGGAATVWAMASHGVFTRAANAAMLDDAVARVVILDTIPPERLAPELVRAKLHAIDATGLFAEAIAVLHSGGSIVDVIGG